VPKKIDTRIQQIGDKLKQLRVQKGYTSYEHFAWENNLPRMQYWRMENGANITIKSLLKVLDVHGISLTKFFEDIN